MKKILLCFTLLAFIAPIFSQKIVDITLQETLTKEEVSALLFGISTEYGIEAYKVLYETMDTDGTIDTASGLMVLPVNEQNDIGFPFLAYQHGTVSARDQVPSNPTVFERRLIYYFAAQGYFTTAADYLGLGDSNRKLHPYIHADTEASAAIDLVDAAKTYVNNQGLPSNSQLFITGYSQGGHAAMAMLENLDGKEVNGLTVAAGSPMSGFYNVSGELLNGSIAEIEYGFPSYLIWILTGYQSVYGNLYANLSDILLPDYIDNVQGFIDGTITRGTLNDLLVDQLIENHGVSIPRFLFTATFLADLESTDPENPVQIALKDNDVFDWVPTHPMRMMYCMADDQVAFTNSTFTDSIMNANGAMDVAAIDVNPTADHGGCVFPATLATYNFFSEIAQPNFILNTHAVDHQLAFQLSPNPASDHIQLTFNNLSNNFGSFDLQLVDFSGKIIRQLSTNNLQNFRFPLNDISSGLYLMQVQTEYGFWTEKIIIK